MTRTGALVRLTILHAESGAMNYLDIQVQAVKQHLPVQPKQTGQISASHENQLCMVNHRRIANLLHWPRN